MTTVPHLLLLAGSGEARKLAQSLAGGPLRVTASLFVTDHWSGPLPVPTRHGGFGGEEGFRAFLKEHGITAVLDATHPFAARVSARSWRICNEMGLPYLQLDRPEWEPGPGDRWTEVATPEEAVALTKPGSRHFVTTGLESWAAFRGATDRRFFFRSLSGTTPPEDLPHICLVPGRGPFSVEHEYRLFEDLHLDGLICKNAGGSVSRTKLEAARALDMDVILLRRPEPSGAPLVRDVAGALEWVDRTCP
ncbi:precorrin-6A/cobalt-precorrin-6A reductase [Aestuariivita boseongensis]|uniref:precorrin-6A/cobalt-precorrin-6A reductase n=1 Tax=Aestuariivita boseongensis TaxID=1470562 RepID=UPI000681350C|nr:precorrin-6A/cobalt-precorrin-6A reductase [Aestuariivita boseongensis]